jgi:DNA-binding GntR family transcriptional regulator
MPNIAETNMQTKLDSTADAIAASLRASIAMGQLRDGTRLVERELADRFSVSRIPLREALHKLEAEGLVEIFTNRGAVVRALTQSDVDEIYGLRTLLEGDAIFRVTGQSADARQARRVES